MESRTFGWIQEAHSIPNLKKVVQIFLPNSEINTLLRTDKIPRLIHDESMKSCFIEELSSEDIVIPYDHLKGKGTPIGFTRTNAPCSGIIQAALPGQRKEYQSDWPADSFLRWAISLGFLDYDDEQDTCALSESGRRYAESDAESDFERECLENALLGMPPVCRVMTLLEKGEVLTKFEIGERLGFIGEAGFTSLPQNLILNAILYAKNSDERRKILSDSEGTSDKYARTICSWLYQMKWVTKENKIFDNIEKIAISQAYRITLEGRRMIAKIRGLSKHAKIKKRVFWHMLATKSQDRTYLRHRRYLLINYMMSQYRTIDDLVKYLKLEDIDETHASVMDDIENFKNIGLSISERQSSYKIVDSIMLPRIVSVKKNCDKSNSMKIKEEIREKLVSVNHKYLVLIDLGFDGNSDRDYESYTASLLIDELNFHGKHLGGSRRPDICVYHEKYGIVIDNKAYSKGYSLPMPHADEMIRYLEENRSRNQEINKNEWWKVFPENMDDFYFLFVSGNFSGTFTERLAYIFQRTGVPGSAVNSVNLLLLAEGLKSGKLSYDDFPGHLASGGEIVI